MERRRGCLEPETGDDHREPGQKERVAGQVLARDGLRDPLERELPRRAVDERGTEEERSGAEAADDEVLEPGLQRAHDVDVDGAEDVERDREPL